MNDAAVERAARALYIRLGGHPGYAKNKVVVGWDRLTATQKRPWLKDVEAVLAAYEEPA